MPLKARSLPLLISPMININRFHVPSCAFRVLCLSLSFASPLYHNLLLYLNLNLPSASNAVAQVCQVVAHYAFNDSAYVRKNLNLLSVV